MNIYETNLLHLIDSELFDFNNFLILYNALITIRQLSPAEGYTEKHHIIPRSYLAYLNLPIDNSKNNLAKLNYFEHILAHYYLYKCTKNLQLKYKMAKAILLIVNSKAAKNIGAIDNLDELLSTEIAALPTDLSEFKKLQAISNSIATKNKWADSSYREARLSWWTKERREAVGNRLLQYRIDHPYHRTKAVICIETEKVFNSVHDAEQFYNTDHHISLCCNNSNRTCGGYHWAYADDVATISKLSKFIGCAPHLYAAKEKIYCEELAMVFNSAVEAANFVHGKSSHIHECCKGKLKTHKKMHWRYHYE